MALDLEPAKLLGLHSLTKQISQVSLRRLKAQFEAMAPLFRPRRFLGDHMEGVGREGIASADRNLADLQELYSRVAIKPFNLRPELRTPLESVTTQFQFDEWEYTHATETDHGWQPIRVTSPLTWVLSYSSAYSLGTLRDVVTGEGQGDPEAIRAFILRACLMEQLFMKVPALTDLLAGLRYKVEVRTSPQLGELPLVTISAPFRTIRPPDQLIALAAGLAGGHSFAEVVDVDSVRNLSDPLRDEALELVKKHLGS
jgi:hypothetical protein